jgi:signal transduction histidine kinase
LRQILVNLLSNAIKFTHEGSVSVRARLSERGSSGVEAVLNRRPAGPSTNQWVTLQVADTGVGVAEQDQERIFDEFEQVNPGPRGDSISRGTGLGLSISRRLARLLGGEISLESELGRGSVFTLWLPVVDPPPDNGWSD